MKNVDVLEKIKELIVNDEREYITEFLNIDSLVFDLQYGLDALEFSLEYNCLKENCQKEQEFFLARNDAIHEHIKNYFEFYPEEIIKYGYDYLIAVTNLSPVALQNLFDTDKDEIEKLVLENIYFFVSLIMENYEPYTFLGKTKFQKELTILNKQYTLFEI